MGNRIEEQNRIGRVWSLCWIAVEIGSINLGRTPLVSPLHTHFVTS